MYSCGYCNAETETLERMLNHVEANHNATFFACYDCDRTYASRGSLKAHTDSFHLGVLYPCEICGKELRSRPSLLVHRQTHEGIAHSCTQCESTFTTRKYLAQHVSIVHTQRSYECDYCDSVLGSRGALNHHMEIHFARRGVCPYCAETMMPSRLAGHLLDVTA